MLESLEQIRKDLRELCRIDREQAAITEITVNDFKVLLDQIEEKLTVEDIERKLEHDNVQFMFNRKDK